ncbi:hypothetical protein GKZ68_01765 [Hymenobacter sp. BRD128]|uniref:hypothetical protein n=1 Tax=Hymenobacter sp. BRD128 TaxID=2675878 RepID=UPI0015641B3F|nr:hypothetical protein [Hymenobacter sp. BRD128]QKG55472.1 hypothetical protein GKZ68_01765 [Hymenobacter sp. BRD128]
MTNAYLRSLGFSPTARTPVSGPASFAHAWRYQFDHLAADGSSLFLEHPLGVDACRLSSREAPLAAQDVFASVGLHDRPALEAAMAAFYAAHGGMGAPLPVATGSAFQAFRRQL